MLVGGGGFGPSEQATSSADVFVFDKDSAGDYSMVMNFSEASGNKIGLDTNNSETLTGDTYSLMAAPPRQGQHHRRRRFHRPARHHLEHGRGRRLRL